MNKPKKLVFPFLLKENGGHQRRNLPPGERVTIVRGQRWAGEHTLCYLSPVLMSGPPGDGLGKSLDLFPMWSLSTNLLVLPSTINVAPLVSFVRVGSQPWLAGAQTVTP